MNFIFAIILTFVAAKFFFVVQKHRNTTGEVRTWRLPAFLILAVAAILYWLKALF